MKLNSRILFLIAPVILFSAAVSTYTIFSSQKEILLKREDSYLQLSMEKLAGHFRQSLSILNSYSFTLIKSDAIRLYADQQVNQFQELRLTDHLKKTISNLQTPERDFTSISVLDGNQNNKYYADSTNDPLNNFDPTLQEYAMWVFEETGKYSHTGYTQNAQGQGVLIRYDVLDNVTLTNPVLFDPQHSFFVVVSVELTQFNALRKIIEFDNKSSIFFTENTDSLEPRPSNLTQTVKLKENFFATLDPAYFLIEAKIDEIHKQLSLSFICSSLLTVLILMALLRKHVTQPITRLDEQLQQVENLERKNIDILKTNDEIGRLSCRFHDMYKELDSTYQKTKALAENDHLTQLSNRYHFQQRIQRALANTLTHKQVWILYLDLDNFKYVNDKYGHQIGDGLLIDFAQHIRKLGKQFEANYGIRCIASRLSGDEFAVFLSSKQDQEQTYIIDEYAKQLLLPLQSNLNSPMSNYPITASVGIATYPQDGNDIASLLSSADAAMYQAKKAGKNQVAYYSRDLDKVVKRRTQIERALRSCNFDKEFYLVYQSYFDSAGKKVVGCEALLRWSSKKLGDVSPQEFIPIAEQTGLFGQIDRWVINRAFSEFATIQAQFDSEVQLSINLSSAELDSTQLAQYIAQKSAEYDVPPTLVDFEITETFATDSQGFPLLHKLSSMGFKLAIDDFGSGYTSITHLVKYPVQKIKLDRTFLEALMKTDNKKVAKPLVELCHSQSMLVTAEGIETKEMHKWLQDYKCDLMQGYFFSKPLPAYLLHKSPVIEKGVELEPEESDHSLA